MSKSTRKARAKAARPGTVASDPEITIRPKPRQAVPLGRGVESVGADPLVDVSTVFTRDELAEMPLIIQRTAMGVRVQVWRSLQGQWYRKGGVLRIQPHEGQRVYKIILYRGATTEDLDELLREVAAMRAGETSRAWEKLDVKWGDDRTFLHRFSSYPYDDPYVCADYSARVRICDEPRCREKWHPDGTYHTLDSITRKLPERRGGYEIEVCKRFGKSARWTVDVFADEFYGTPEDVASFVSDLQWMQEECRRANLPNPEPTAGEILKQASDTGVKPSKILAGVAS